IASRAPPNNCKGLSINTPRATSESTLVVPLQSFSEILRSELPLISGNLSCCSLAYAGVVCALSASSRSFAFFNLTERKSCDSAPERSSLISGIVHHPLSTLNGVKIRIRLQEKLFIFLFGNPFHFQSFSG